jgi:hypothetical protein
MPALRHFQFWTTGATGATGPVVKALLSNNIRTCCRHLLLPAPVVGTCYRELKMSNKSVAPVAPVAVSIAAGRMFNGR